MSWGSLTQASATEPYVAFISQSAMNQLGRRSLSVSGVIGNYTLRQRSGKAKPGALRYSTAGIGTSPHLFSELMNLMAGTRTVHVPYKGGAPSMIAVAGGEVDYSFLAVATALSQLTTGHPRALGVTGAKPTPHLSRVPAIASGLPGYEGLKYHALRAPAGAPAPIVSKIQRQVAAILHKNEVK